MEFSAEEKATIANIAQKFAGAPIPVRSSAEGDSHGTGVYESHFCMNDGKEMSPESELADAIKKVIASAYSDGAIAFRKDKGLPEGIAVMIENVFGQEYVSCYERSKKDGNGEPVRDENGDNIHETAEARWFAPNLSGCGYTSTPSGNGYVVLTAGMPTKAVGDNDVLKAELSEENAGKNIVLMIYDENMHRPWQKQLRMTYSKCDVLFYGGFSDFRGLLSPPCMVCDADAKVVPSVDINDISFRPLYDKLKKLEELAGKPQYFEFAMRMKDGKEEYAILQVADVVPKVELVEFPKEPENLLAESKYVVGEGRVTCNGVFVCPAPDFCPSYPIVDKLEEYNNTHKGYLLIVDSSYFSTMKGNLAYSDFNNASAVLAVLSHEHSQGSWDYDVGGVAIMHFQGLFRETDKLFIEVNWRWDETERLPGQIGVFGQPGLMPVAKDLKVEVIVSEKQRRGIAMLVKDEK